MSQDQRASATDLDQAASDFAAARPRLFGIAYRMLGSAVEAEDVVQEAWLRWQTCDRSVVRDPTAFLATTTTRLAINAVRAARTRHETYVGPWLPEPVDTSADPTLGAERSEALELAVMLLLERLSPAERAAYVLREAFDYPYREIASVLQASEVAVRQYVSRARKRLASERHAPVSPDQQHLLLDAFVGAAQRGDMDALEALFATDVVSYADGGGVVTAARIPVVGRERVARVVAAFATNLWTGATITTVQANGQPAVLLTRGDVPVALVTVSASAEGIERLLWVLNPTKLAGIAQAAEHAAR
jgi:RNA polymerase sigma-70 factor (ECF subfamily)